MATQGERYEALCVFLGRAFTRSDFHMSLVLNGYGEIASVVDREVATTAYFFDFVAEMDRRKLINAAFFAFLRRGP